MAANLCRACLIFHCRLVAQRRPSPGDQSLKDKATKWIWPLKMAKSHKHIRKVSSIYQFHITGLFIHHYPSNTFISLYSYLLTMINIVFYYSLFVLRDWSLISGRAGATKREGGAREVLPLRKGGAEFFLAMLKEGHKTFWGSF